MGDLGLENPIAWLLLLGLLLGGGVVLYRRRRQRLDQDDFIGRRSPGDVDYAELEQAEREVQEAPDEDSVRDWGPGVKRPPVG